MVVLPPPEVVPPVAPGLVVVPPPVVVPPVAPGSVVVVPPPVVAAASSSVAPEPSVAPFGPPAPWPGLEASTPSTLLPFPLLAVEPLPLPLPPALLPSGVGVVVPPEAPGPAPVPPPAHGSVP